MCTTKKTQGNKLQRVNNFANEENEKLQFALVCICIELSFY
jgi:hypothetical protein